MATDSLVKLSGKVTSINRGGLFKIAVPMPTTTNPENTLEVLANCSGKMKQFSIKIVVGDLVDLEVSPYHLGKGRIVRRHKA